MANNDMSDAMLAGLDTGVVISMRNQLDAEIDRRTAKQNQNTPEAMQLVREFLNWYGWYEREGFDDESREELERLVEDSRTLLSANTGESR